jgi:hypothetical protein
LISHIAQGQLQSSFTTPLFTNEQLCYPGFLEFSVENELILTRCSNTQQMKLWHMLDYRLHLVLNLNPVPTKSINFKASSTSSTSSLQLPSAAATNSVQEIKLIPGLMLVLREKTAEISGSVIPLQLVDLKTGKVFLVIFYNFKFSSLLI